MSAQAALEMQRIQEKLEQSERRLRYVLDATGDGIWDWDIVEGMVKHNRRWCQIVGLGDDYLLHPLPDFANLLHEDDKFLVIDKLRLCLAGQSSYCSEHRLRLPSKQIIWVLDRGDVVERGPDGTALRMVGSLTDITARKAMELEAQHASQLLREAVSSIAQGFTIYDEQDRLYLCNETYINFYDTSRDLLVPGNTFEMIVRRGAERGQYSDAIGNLESWVKRRVDQHQAANGEVIEQQLSDGRWLLIVESRTPSGFIVGNRLDITARKKAEAQVREHSAQFEAIFALSPDGFVSFDATRRVKYVNPAFVHMTGLTHEDVAGLDESKFSHCLVMQGLNFCGLAAMRGMAHDQDGEVQRQIIERGPEHAIGAHGHRVFSLGLRESTEQSVSQILHLRDITHETEVERLKSEFLRTAAHELRTPMASIFGFVELLLYQHHDAATSHEFLGIIFKQSQQMIAILNELLDLAHIDEWGAKDFRAESIALQSLLSEVVRCFKLPPGQAAPFLHMPQAPLMVTVDRKKMIQAILNVLANAYKYSEPQGLIRITLELRAGQAALCIKDQGIGMTPDQVRRVGERFYRADTSGKVPGTGLGMSIVNEIVALHHGSVLIESEIKKGTSITLLLPLAAVDPVTAKNTPCI